MPESQNMARQGLNYARSWRGKLNPVYIPYFFTVFAACLCAALLSSCAAQRVKPPPLQPIGKKEVKLHLVWRTNLGVGSRLQQRQQIPAEGVEEVYMCDASRVVALRLSNGKRLWRKKLDNPISGCISLYGDTLYISDEEANVYAMDAQTREILWKTEVEINSDTPPSANENIVLIQTVNEKLFALDANSGSQLWSYSAFNPGLSLFGSFRPLIIGNNVITGFADGSIVIFDAISGNPVSFSQLVVPQGDNDIERLVDIDGTAIIKGRILYVSSYGDSTLALDLSSGTEVWRRPIGSPYSLIFSEDALFVVDKDSRIHALDFERGETLWTNEDFMGRDITAPNLLDNYIIFGDVGGFVHAVAVEDGRSIGRKRISLRPLKNFVLASSSGLLFLDTEGFTSLIDIKN